MIAAVRKQGLEGVVAKCRDSTYESGRRSGSWVKLRIGGGQEFVIGGYTPSPKNFDALVIGYYEAGSLLYAARTRNGFTPALRSQGLRTIQRSSDLRTIAVLNIEHADLPLPYVQRVTDVKDLFLPVQVKFIQRLRSRLPGKTVELLPVDTDDVPKIASPAEKGSENIVEPG